MTETRDTESDRGKKTISLNILIDRNDDSHLSQLIAATGWSKAQVLRTALGHLHTMLILKVPTCASGDRCFVPHLHAQQDPPPPHHAIGDP